MISITLRSPKIRGRSNFHHDVGAILAALHIRASQRTNVCSRDWKSLAVTGRLNPKLPSPKSPL